MFIYEGVNIVQKFLIEKILQNFYVQINKILNHNKQKHQNKSRVGYAN